jgi:light-regulated signal transduction histidine kinase (bacteriophytochrome)
MTAPAAPPSSAGPAGGLTTVDLLPAGTPVDLTNCDREPVHLVGGVQPYGALLVVDPADLRVRQASANAAALLGTAGPVLGASLAGVVGAAAADALAAAAAAADDAGRVYHATPVAVGDRRFEVTAHRQAEGLVFEVEPADSEGPALDLGAFHATVRRTMAAVARGTSVRAVAGAVAEEVRRVTGFDRVWVYKFHEDWHGEIIAEARDASVEESWLDLHYPAADIPAPARALFLRHWIRLIADVQAAPSPLEPALSPATGAPLDLGDCVLRAVSPVHTEYLTNMGVRASMSVSLVRDGALWGLVSCHHYAGPRRVPHDVRAACELLAQAFSTQLGLVEQAEDRDYAIRLGEVRGALLERMARERDVVDGLMAEPGLLLELAGAEGAAVCLAEGECATVGRTPPAAEVAALARWLVEQGHDTYATDALGAAYPPAAAYADVASGGLAVGLSRVRPYYVLWFRPQAAQTLRWGGDPRTKPVRVGADGIARLSPRGSFAAWEEEAQGRSHPWRRAEVEAVRALRGTVVDALLTRADELAALNRALERSNRELDDFAYVASHDLKEPLRGIHNYAAMVAEDYAGQPLDADGLARLGTIQRLTTRLDGLLDSLLEHARVGRLDLELAPVDANAALADARERLEVSLAERGATVRVPRPLPGVRADRERLVEVFMNLVSNAAKYGGPSPEIEVGYLGDDAGPAGGPVPASPTFYVRDHGIGIEPRHHAAVFRLFKRLHPRDAYGGGSGAGLTIVQKVAERHGGRVWLESAPGAGTTVFFTLAGAGVPAGTPVGTPPAGTPAVRP